MHLILTKFSPSENGFWFIDWANYTIEKQLPSSFTLHTLGHEIWKSHVSYAKEQYDKSKADLQNRQTWTDNNLKYQPEMVYHKKGHNRINER